MTANIGRDWGCISIPGYKTELRNRREAEMVARLKDYCEGLMKEDQMGMCVAVEAAWLIVLMRKLRWRPETAFRYWLETVRLRAEYKHEHRHDGGCEIYQEERTGKNIEDTACLVELRHMGVNLEAWENSINYDPAEGTVETNYTEKGWKR